MMTTTDAMRRAVHRGTEIGTGAEQSSNGRKRFTRPVTTQKVERWSDVPEFAGEDEEAAYWGTHSLAGEALESMQPGPIDLLPEPPEAFDRPQTEPRTRPIAVRLDADMLRRLKAIAGRKNKGYQTLLKEFVAERLYEVEKREGLVVPKRGAEVVA